MATWLVIAATDARSLAVAAGVEHTAALDGQCFALEYTNAWICFIKSFHGVYAAKDEGRIAVFAGDAGPVIIGIVYAVDGRIVEHHRGVSGDGNLHRVVRYIERASQNVAVLRRVVARQIRKVDKPLRAFHPHRAIAIGDKRQHRRGHNCKGVRDHLGSIIVVAGEGRLDGRCASAHKGDYPCGSVDGGDGLRARRRRAVGHRKVVGIIERREGDVIFEADVAAHAFLRHGIVAEFPRKLARLLVLNFHQSVAVRHLEGPSAVGLLLRGVLRLCPRARGT